MSFITLGVRPGAVVAIAIPVTLATVFLIMQTRGIDLHRVSLGALIIALALLVDDATTTVDAMLRRLAAGDTIAQAAPFAYGTLAAPMLTGTLITIACFVPIGFAQSQGRRIHHLAVQRRRHRADQLVVRRRAVTPILSGVLLRPPEVGWGGAAARGDPARLCARAHARHQISLGHRRACCRALRSRSSDCSASTSNSSRPPTATSSS